MVARYKYKVAKGIEEANQLAEQGWRAVNLDITLDGRFLGRGSHAAILMEFDKAG